MTPRTTGRQKHSLTKAGRYVLTALLLAVAPALLAGCSFLTQDTEGSAQGTVFLWLGSDKDAFVSCGQPVQGQCPEENRNFGSHGSLVVANNGSLKKSYVHFGLPILPSGSTVEEAYFELYHPGKNEDGETDDIRIPLARAVDSWSPGTITVNDHPQRGWLLVSPNGDP